MPLIRPAVSVAYEKMKKTATQISGWASTGSRGTLSTVKENSMGNVSRMNVLSTKSGYKVHTSHDDILLQGARNETV